MLSDINNAKDEGENELNYKSSTVDLPTLPIHVPCLFLTIVFICKEQ